MKKGGARKGAGLAPDAAGQKTAKHTVTLDAFTVAFLELLGNGNLSRGIREAARKLAPKKTPHNVDLQATQKLLDKNLPNTQNQS